MWDVTLPGSLWASSDHCHWWFWTRQQGPLMRQARVLSSSIVLHVVWFQCVSRELHHKGSSYITYNISHIIYHISYIIYHIISYHIISHAFSCSSSCSCSCSCSRSCSYCFLIFVQDGWNLFHPIKFRDAHSSQRRQKACSWNIEAWNALISAAGPRRQWMREIWEVLEMCKEHEIEIRWIFHRSTICRKGCGCSFSQVPMS